MNKKVLFVTVEDRRKGTAEEIVLDRPKALTPCKLTIGDAPECEIQAPVKGRRRLIQRTLTGYALALPVGLDASVSEGGGPPVDVKGLAELGLLKRRGEKYLLPMRRVAGFVLSFDDTVVTFGFMAFAPGKETQKLDRSLKKPLFTRADRAYRIILLASAIAHFAFVGYLGTVEIREKEATEIIRDISPRFAKLILQPPEPPPVKRHVARTIAEEEAPEQREEKEQAKKEGKPSKEAERKAAQLKPASSAPSGSAPLARTPVASRGLLGIITSKARPMPALDDGLFEAVDGANAGKGAETRGRRDLLAGLDVKGLEDGHGIPGIPEGAASSGGTSQTRSSEEIIKEKRDVAIDRGQKEKKTITTGGQRDESEVYRAVVAYTGGLKYLYNNTLRKQPSLRGKVTARIVISPAGKVLEARITYSSLEAPELEDAIVKRIYMWKFPESKTAENFTIDYSFDFAPVG